VINIVNNYDDYLGKLVSVEVGFFSSTIGELHEYDREKSMYKVSAGKGWVVVGLDEVKFLTPEQCDAHIEWLDKNKNVEYVDETKDERDEEYELFA
jgi:hypothetical protein